MKKPLTTIGERVRYLRKLRNISGAQLSKNLRISSGNLSEIERDNYRPSLKLLIKFCEYFKISAHWLIFGVGEVEYDAVDINAYNELKQEVLSFKKQNLELEKKLLNKDKEIIRLLNKILELQTGDSEYSSG